MNHRRMFTALLFGILALAALAPIASAKPHDRDDDSHWRTGDNSYDRSRDIRGNYGNYYDRDDRGRRNTWVSRRSYYYLDPRTGQRSSYISDFKDRDGYADPALVILMIDIRSGREIGAYRYDNRAGHWRAWTAYRGQSWNDNGNYRYDRRGTGVYGGYPRSR